MVVPNIVKASTEATRQVLPESVSREQYVRNMGYVARISAAFAKSDIRTIIQTLPWDSFVEPTLRRGWVLRKRSGLKVPA